jgi:hypothetical protein
MDHLKRVTNEFARFRSGDAESLDMTDADLQTIATAPYGCDATK